MAMMQAPISSRNEFARLLNRMQLKGTAVEVGTHRGDFARTFMNDWEGRLLCCVDPWCKLPGYDYQEAFLWSSTDRHTDYLVTKSKLNKFGNRVKLMQQTSEEACKAFNENSIDFVFLDGNHEPPYVEQDIDIWWPKISHGGILAGHDFLCPGPDASWGKYIQPAILNFVYAECPASDLFLVIEENGLPWSYYILKP